MPDRWAEAVNRLLTDPEHNRTRLAGVAGFLKGYREAKARKGKPNDLAEIERVFGPLLRGLGL